MQKLPRRQFILFSTAAATGLLMPRRLLAAEGAPTDNPAAHLKQAWTNDVKWANVVDVAKMPGDDTDTKLAAAQDALAKAGGGVAYFPAGTYTFKTDIKLRDGVILRGATPKVVTDAKKDRYDPPTKFVFPKYKPTFEGDGTPINSAFKGVTLANPAGGKHTGVVNIDINRAHIDLGEGDDHECAGHRIVFGCVLRNAAVADPRVPDPKIGQHKWQRFTQRHHAAIDVVGENVLIANNRLPKSGDHNFTQKGFILKPHRGKPAVYDVTFDYDNRPGLYINHYCVGGAGGSGNDGTPETHPYGFRKGTVIVDNYVYNTGRMCIGFSGDGTVCARNITRIEKDVWRPTNTGHGKTTGSSTNDNRAIEMRGWRWRVEDNDCVVHKNWAAERNYLHLDLQVRPDRRPAHRGQRRLHAGQHRRHLRRRQPQLRRPALPQRAHREQHHAQQRHPHRRLTRQRQRRQRQHAQGRFAGLSEERGEGEDQREQELSGELITASSTPRCAACGTGTVRRRALRFAGRCSPRAI